MHKYACMGKTLALILFNLMASNANVVKLPHNSNCYDGIDLHQIVVVARRAIANRLPYVLNDSQASPGETEVFMNHYSESPPSKG